MYQIHSKGVGHHENYNYRKKYRTDRGIKGSGRGEAFKLEKFFAPDTNVFVTLSVEKERQKIEVTIPIKGHVIRSEQSSNDMYVSIDLVEEVIERQLRKYRTKLCVQEDECSRKFQRGIY